MTLYYRIDLHRLIRMPSWPTVVDTCIQYLTRTSGAHHRLDRWSRRSGQLGIQCNCRISFRCKSTEEYGGTPTRIDPEADLRTVADAAMSHVPGAPLYARVDVVRGTTGAYHLMGLELVEPALYFRTGESVPEKFARALDRWWNSTQSWCNDTR